MAPGFDRGMHALGQLGEEAAVGNGVHRIQAQAVEAVVEQPHQRVIDEEVPYFAAAEVDGIAPGGLLVMPEEVPSVAPQVVAVRAEVVVDHIEKHHQAQAVGRVDQVLELFRAAVGGFRRVGQDAVVAPVAVAGKFGDRHQFDGGDAQLDEPGQVLLHCGESAIEAGMQLVEHRLVPGPAAPLGVAPAVTGVIDHHARGMHVAGLGTRSGVGHLQLVVDQEAVQRAGAIRHVDAVPAVFLGAHRQRLRTHYAQADLLRIRGPEPETGGPAIQYRRTVPPGMGTLPLHGSPSSE
ncbi:hypothetical protein BAY1663_00874 [Pseudomonas sp. BAY1663]|nr:hypothetical protein BAY1663_00874 [Pseudomonas sp. BAY1663]